MMKQYLLLFGLLGVAAGLQAQAYEGNTQYDKKKQAAIICEYAFPPQAVENAFTGVMGKQGYRAREEKGILNRDKGFLLFKNAYITDISKEKLDYIVKVERKGRKENEESVLYLVIQKDGVNAIDQLDAREIRNAKSYLNDLLPDIEAAHLELQIKSLEDLVSKSEKKLKGLQDEKLALETKLAENMQGQEDTRKEIETQQANLETLRGKRKKN